MPQNYRNKEKLSTHRTGSGGRRKDKISHETLMALAMAEGNTTSDSTNCLSAMDSYQGDTCTSFEYKKHSKRRRHQQQKPHHKHSSSNVDKHSRVAKYLGAAPEKRRVQSQDEETQVLTCSKKDSSSQTDLKIPHCVTSLLSQKEASAAIEQTIRKIIEEQEIQDDDLTREGSMLLGYSEESLLDPIDFEEEKADEPKETQYNFETVDESHYLRYLSSFTSIIKSRFFFL